MAIAGFEVLTAVLSRQGESGSPDQAFALLTVDSGGFPFVCLLSTRQLAVRGEHIVALVHGRRTASNLERDGRATLHVIHEGASVLAGLQVSSLKELEMKTLFFFDVVTIESERRSTTLTPIAYHLDQDVLDAEGPSVSEIMKSID